MKPELQLVPEFDPSTGEVLCSRCAATENAAVQLERKLRAAYAQITRMETDAEAEARRHKGWAEVEGLFDWWRLATGHFGVSFGADEFYPGLRRVAEVGPVVVLQGVAGLAFDPNSKPMRNGRVQFYDSWELLTRSRSKLESAAERAPHLPDPHRWKRWLIDRIESQFQPKGAT